MSQYNEVPVAVARQIAEAFSKSIVIVCSWDPQHGVLHITTYGSGAKEKVWAARGGDVAGQALGADLNRMQVYADWRLDRIRALEAALRLVLHAQIDGSTDQPTTEERP